MPAKSEKQRSAFGMALAARRGELPAESLTVAARKLFKDSSLSVSQLEDYVKKPEERQGKQRFGGTKPRIRGRRG